MRTKQILIGAGLMTAIGLSAWAASTVASRRKATPSTSVAGSESSESTRKPHQFVGEPTALPRASAAQRRPDAVDSAAKGLFVLQRATDNLSQQQPVTEDERHIAWPENTPPEHSKAGVEDVLSEVSKVCGLGAEKTWVSCDEPPCIAVFRNPSFENFQDLPNCKAWQEKYPPTTGGNVFTADCNGVEQRYYTLSPYWPELWEVEDSVRQERMDRFRIRLESIEEEACDL